MVTAAPHVGCEVDLVAMCLWTTVMDPFLHRLKDGGQDSLTDGSLGSGGRSYWGQEKANGRRLWFPWSTIEALAEHSSQ